MENTVSAVSKEPKTSLRASVGSHSVNELKTKQNSYIQMENRIARENDVCFWAKVDQLPRWLYSGCGHWECVIELAWRRHPEEGQWLRSRRGRGLSGLRPSHMWTLRSYRIAGLRVGMQVCTVFLDERKFRRWFWDGDLRWPVSHSGVRRTCAYEVYMFMRVCICVFVHTCMEVIGSASFYCCSL